METKSMKNYPVRYILCMIVLSLSILLTGGCGVAKSVSVGIKNAESYVLDGRYRLQGSYPADIGRFSRILPRESVIAYIDLEEPHSVYLAYKSEDQRRYVGDLTYLAPDVPVKMMLFAVGDEYHAVGWVDESVDGTVDMVSMFSRNASTSYKRAGTNPVSRIFQFPIYLEDEWSDINSVRIHTIETMINNSAGKEPSVAWEMNFSPPLSFEEMKEKAVPVALP